MNFNSMVAAIKAFSFESWSALMTWAIVSGSGLYFMISSGNHSVMKIIAAAALYILFIILWLAAARDAKYAKDKLIRTVLIVAIFTIVICLYFLVPFTYTAILAVLLCSILPFVVSFKTALALSPLFSLPLWLVYGFYWGYTNTLLTAVLFWSFNLFALVMINSMLREKASSDELSAKNRELLATHSLLKQAAQQSERIRIARNIHDLLGHHLTALTIKLQVAERISDGNAKAQIAECHGLAKLLLSDVREAVTEIRDKSRIDLTASIHQIASATPRLNVNVNLDQNLVIQDVAVAEVILRTIQESITNSLKHSNATQMDISLVESSDTIELSIVDNNTVGASAFTMGNGLTGILERAKEVHGMAEFTFTDKGFKTTLQLGRLL